LQLVAAIDAIWDWCVVLLSLDIPLSLLGCRQEVLEVVVFHLLVAPFWRVLVFVRQCSSEERYNMAVDALRAHHGSVDDPYLNWRFGLLLQTEAAFEADVRHAGRRWCWSELFVGVVGS
jgi:hypothetical protein